MLRVKNQLFISTRSPINVTFKETQRIDIGHIFYGTTIILNISDHIVIKVPLTEPSDVLSKHLLNSIF